MIRKIFGFIGEKEESNIQCNISDDEIVEKVVNNRDLRKKVIEKIEVEVREALLKVFVEALKIANEKPSKWWEWLFLLLVGMAGGIGVGYALAIKSIGPPIP